MSPATTTSDPNPVRAKEREQSEFVWATCSARFQSSPLGRLTDGRPFTSWLMIAGRQNLRARWSRTTHSMRGSNAITSPTAMISTVRCPPCSTATWQTALTRKSSENSGSRVVFNHKRLSLARKRRRLTGKGLAELARISAITVSRLENGENQPDEETVGRLARALEYPTAFFFDDDPEEVATGSVSFRSLTKMSAKERDAAIAAGSLGLQLSDWVEGEFRLPKANIIDLSYETDPEAAAGSLRQFWSLGEKPIGDVLGLLEVNGIRVFSLAENTATVDAFSFWRNQRPFVFLNNYKTAEHSIYDSVHELGHLAMHRHAGTQPSRAAEREANQFASAFLMPANDVRARMPRFITVDAIIEAK